MRIRQLLGGAVHRETWVESVDGYLHRRCVDATAGGRALDIRESILRGGAGRGIDIDEWLSAIASARTERGWSAEQASAVCDAAAKAFHVERQLVAEGLLPEGGRIRTYAAHDIAVAVHLAHAGARLGFADEELVAAILESARMNAAAVFADWEQFAASWVAAQSALYGSYPCDDVWRDAVEIAGALLARPTSPWVTVPFPGADARVSADGDAHSADGDADGVDEIRASPVDDAAHGGHEWVRPVTGEQRAERALLAERAGHAIPVDPGGPLYGGLAQGLALGAFDAYAAGAPWNSLRESGAPDHAVLTGLDREWGIRSGEDWFATAASTIGLREFTDADEQLARTRVDDDLRRVGLLPPGGRVDTLAGYSLAWSVRLARLGAQAGLGDPDEAAQMMLAARDTAARVFASWTEFACSVLAGKLVYEDVDRDDLLGGAATLLTRDHSPWRALPFPISDQAGRR
nr:DUF1266 domain-containing protein [Gordonia araii]